MESINNSRRHAILSSLFAPALFIAACSSTPIKPAPVQVDVSAVTDVPSLLAAIKRSAGSRLPSTIPESNYLNEFAKVFVENARSAAEQGFKVPKWVLNKLPQNRKTVLPVIAAVPFLGLATFTIGAVELVIPVAGIIVAVLGSIVLMTAAIIGVIAAMVSASHKT